MPKHLLRRYLFAQLAAFSKSIYGICAGLLILLSLVVTVFYSWTTPVEAKTSDNQIVTLMNAIKTNQEQLLALNQRVDQVNDRVSKIESKTSLLQKGMNQLQTQVAKLVKHQLNQESVPAQPTINSNALVKSNASMKGYVDQQIKQLKNLVQIQAKLFQKVAAVNKQLVSYNHTLLKQNQQIKGDLHALYTH